MLGTVLWLLIISELSWSRNYYCLISRMIKMIHSDAGNALGAAAREQDWGLRLSDCRALLMTPTPRRLQLPHCCSVSHSWHCSLKAGTQGCARLLCIQDMLIFTQNKNEEAELVLTPLDGACSIFYPSGLSLSVGLWIWHCTSHRGTELWLLFPEERNLGSQRKCQTQGASLRHWG